MVRREPKTRPCHGCGGRGWVPVNGRAQICPVCLGDGEKPARLKDRFRPRWMQ